MKIRSSRVAAATVAPLAAGATSSCTEEQQQQVADEAGRSVDAVRILSWNIKGIRPEVVSCLRRLIAEHGIDIVALQEWKNAAHPRLGRLHAWIAARRLGMRVAMYTRAPLVNCDLLTLADPSIELGPKRSEYSRLAWHGLAARRLGSLWVANVHLSPWSDPAKMNEAAILGGELAERRALAVGDFNCIPPRSPELGVEWPPTREVQRGCLSAVRHSPHEPLRPDLSVGCQLQAFGLVETAQHFGTPEALRATNGHDRADGLLYAPDQCWASASALPFVIRDEVLIDSQAEQLSDHRPRLVTIAGDAVVG